MCSTVTADDFNTIHHELGHVQYYIQYQNLSIFFKQGANPAFHEALGDAISLSVYTPEHLFKIGITDEVIASRGLFDAV